MKRSWLNLGARHAFQNGAWHLYWCERCRTVARWLRRTAYAIAAKDGTLV